ncbi:glycosyltransferase family protein [Roseimaritima ulvae]|uniref:Glucosyl-3-phosphoglycerate synthase n=1 Tax=Roseimaritima ulvae TaxID=980254 RepID=A0A5B9R716_9BACT|nr:glycosyl transferase [Roseimaritima ulvae]QEG42441.1 Glucosyl-3-phosphoglycerate synthase [Roseimaritima ulvae]
MADFAQGGMIGTLHNLRNRPLEELEAELMDASEETPMTLVLPCLYSELEGPAMGPIVEKLSEVKYLKEIVIGLDRADRLQFEHARRFFERLNQPHRILWNDGPRLREVDATIAQKGLEPNEAGKGRNVWYCMGYFLASGQSKAMALHDCDIVTYERELLSRLFFPIVHPALNYVFAKGYYYRAAEGRLNGRVFRLLVAPLLRAMKMTLGTNDYLSYMSSFRYALSGEFAMRSEVVSSLRIPSDWGLEIGTLSEMHRSYAPHRVCQVDIADAYDHKHQPVSEDNPKQGLHRMSTDICKAFIRKLAVNGTVFSPELFRTLKACYYRTALDMLDHYYSDAVMAGLRLDRHEESQTIELFAQSLMHAGEEFFAHPDASPFIASWSRVVSAFPDILSQLTDAVAADSAS